MWQVTAASTKARVGGVCVLKANFWEVRLDPQEEGRSEDSRLWNSSLIHHIAYLSGRRKLVSKGVSEVQMKKLSKKTVWISGQKNHNRRADIATSWRQRNLRSRWRIRQYKDGDVRMSRTASAPSANELAWFYKGFRQSAHPEGVPNAS